MQYFAFRIILLIATNLKYCLWLVKYTLDCISKIKLESSQYVLELTTVKYS